MALLLTNTHVVIKVISALVVNKLVAIYLGPSGIAVIGQFQNISSLISSLAHGSIQTGNIKYVSEHRDNKEILRKVLSSSIFITLSLTLFTAVITYLFAREIGELAFLPSDSHYLIRYFALTLFFYSANTSILSFLNGFGKIKSLTFLNIIQSVCTVLTVPILIFFYQLNGVVISLLSTQALLFCISCILYRKKLGKASFFGGIGLSSVSREFSVRLLKYAFVTFSLGIIASVTMLLIRGIIINEGSLDSAGIWEGGWKVLLYFNMIFASPFSIFYFPRMSKCPSLHKANKMMLDAIKILVPMMLLLAFIIYCLKDIFIRVLFSTSFLALADILGLLLVAEIFRVVATFFQNLYLANAKIAIVVILQVIYFGLFVSLSYVGFRKFGLTGIAVSYLLSSVFFLSMYLVCHFSRRLSKLVWVA
ncbi:oligosaccharide flippase family protein [Akkermansiaceae bacterium]|nr:oligosaccharide flippase family protein [Akkermansiaceae bacterium]